MARTLGDRVATYCLRASPARQFALWAIGIVLSMSAWGQALQPIPPYAPVVDLVGVLTHAEQIALTQKLAAFNRAYGSELGVVLVSTTQPEPIEDYANRLANTWKLGRQTVGDGAVLVIAVSDRASRIEVSRALEGAIPDLEAKRILQRNVTPALRGGAFHEGIEKGLDALFADIEHENLPRPGRRGSESPGIPGAGQATSPLALAGMDAASATGDRAGGPRPSGARGGLVAATEYVFLALMLLAQLVWPVVIIWLLLKLFRSVGKVSPSSSDDDSPSFSNTGGSMSSNSSTDNSTLASSSGGGDYAGGGASDRW